MADQDTWLESRVGKNVRVVLAYSVGVKAVTEDGNLDAVEENGIIIGGRWFNRSQIAFVRELGESGPTEGGIRGIHV